MGASFQCGQVCAGNKEHDRAGLSGLIRTLYLATTLESLHEVLEIQVGLASALIKRR